MSQQPGTPAPGPGAGEDPSARRERYPGEEQGRTAPAPGNPPAPGSAAAPRGSAPRGGEPPRLPPRPLHRPSVDPAQATAFGRPRGVRGSFDAHSRSGLAPRGIQQLPPPPESLNQAFGRPAGSREVLQRTPGEPEPTTAPADDPVLWESGSVRDPWRDPSAAAVLGPPATTAAEASAATSPTTAGPLLSAREVLFGRRVHPKALALLGVAALVVSIAGGFIGRVTAEEGNPLINPDVTLAEVQAGADRPDGSVAAVAQRVVPAVVSVEVRVGAQGGSGSGVVIDGNGYVVTNNHVVSMAVDTPNAEISAVFHDGTRAPARIVGRDVKTDLAVLKVEVANPTVAQLGDSDSLAVGDQVIAIGSPLGLAGTVTTGIVSSVHRPVRLAGEGTDTNAVIDAIQTDAAVNPGNSGGALVDGNGAVVGINSAIRTLGAGGEGGSIGLGFAIPIDDVRRIAEELIRTGHVQHADLGVNAKSVSDGLADGAQVQNVQDGSAAAGAGIAEGDVIIQVGDREVRSADELIVAVDRHRVGDTVPVTLVRQGRELVLDVTLH
ncbi:trypsin-like peptidase domain-containing protein [Saccharopolyspora cebuensis]|uniref:Trypsin-like peptidase domain-containing protein n=1 Tax=Saccharopolyspora cebuensis TaxID=418759 RepID=A0ABV4CKZ0_9PSEU